MLDDLKVIHERDAQDALGIASKQHQQLLWQPQIVGEGISGHIQNVVFSGMGGSALAALMMHTWPRVDRPFEVVRDYSLPPYVGSETLVIVSSYSGNTEETLQALEEAVTKGAKIIVIAGGGALWEIAEQRNYVRVLLPKAAQPRYAVLYSLRALIGLLQHTGVLQRDVSGELQAAAELLQRSVDGWLPTVPTSRNPAKQLALELIGKSVVVYAGPKLAPAAYKWKISFNENAKQIAWWNSYPEFNHNEFIGWTKQPTDKPYGVVDLRGSCEHPRVLKRFEVTARLLSGMRPEAHVVTAQGSNEFEQMLWAIMFGDFVTLYVALLNGLNPAPVELVERFKQELAA